MRQTWKGMIIGALVGASIGLVLEAFKSLSENAPRAARGVQEQAPGIAHELAGRATHLRDSEVVDRVTRAAQAAGQHVRAAAEAGLHSDR